ncbi:MAG: YiiX family permuted papain-like enzyme [Cytophagaceae bacterium]
MKKKLLAGILISCLACLVYAGEITQDSVEIISAESFIVLQKDMQDGDVIFQSSMSGQSQAIQLATHSKYSHCGILFKEGDNFMVFEAVQPVKKTPLTQWIARGDDKHYVVKRLKNREQVLTTEVVKKMKETAKGFEGKNYDLYFEWTDANIYCSELVWKIYKRAAGVEIGKLEKLKNFDLSNPIVKAKMKERYGSKIPMEEEVISPAAIYDSPLLETVKSE